MKTDTDIAIEAINEALKASRDRAIKSLCETTCPGKVDLCRAYERAENCPKVKQFLKHYNG
ncbi:hypothetical protein [Bacteroides sp. UBA939]|uniref:hypothetical protein n=1 Tax=Bacteroides sp. UBA939 TaxID=1946092 RepID=UPI0025C49DEB|nr:hypothetical protein [Bacteroides sp. UBA939]